MGRGQEPHDASGGVTRAEFLNAGLLATTSRKEQVPQQGYLRLRMRHFTE